MQYCLLNRRSNAGDNASTSFQNTVNIGPVTLQFKRIECGNCAVTRLQFVFVLHSVHWRSKTAIISKLRLQCVNQ